MTTYELFDRLYKDHSLVLDESAPDSERSAAAFRYDKNIAEVERRAQRGDRAAQSYLAEAEADYNAEFETERALRTEGWEEAN